uniref:PDZ domain-containing protein n=1 Tax=Brugia malayi TaxID=6279 RepID=A0A7I4KR18_BRUMA
MIADNEELHHLYVNIDAGELPGISYTKDLTVTFVQRSGALEDRINVGDKILAVNDCSQVKSNKEGHVYVTRVLNGSLSAECLIVGDRILQVNGTIINDKEMAKKIIVQGLLKGNISILVERPDSSKARNFISEVLSVRTPPNTEICH